MIELKFVNDTANHSLGLRQSVIALPIGSDENFPHANLLIILRYIDRNKLLSWK